MSEPEAWARSFTQATNEDAEIGAHGEYYSCSFMWDMGDRKVLVDMHKGKVERINLDPQPLDAYQFAPRAPAETWRRALARAVYALWVASRASGDGFVAVDGSQMTKADGWTGDCRITVEDR
jgi:hypothetical protein